MKKDKTYFKIGAFVLAVCAVLIAGILFISADTIGNDAILLETYIDESVMGLSIGSEVLHRGVKIGQVQKITFVPQEYPMSIDGPEFTKFSRYVVVLMAIDVRNFPDANHNLSIIETMIRNQVKMGLRFKLNYQGITGIAFMEADYVDPEREIPLSVPWVPKRIYVPSTPSVIQNFTQALDTIFQRLEQIDIEGAIANMKTTLATIDQGIQDARIGEVRESFVALVNEVRQSNKQLQPLLAKTETIPDEFNTAIDHFNATMQRVEILLGRHEPDIDEILSDIEILAQNFRQLSESLKQDPAQILLSSPPKHSEVVQ